MSDPHATVAVIDFGDSTVKEVMTPLKRVVWISPRNRLSDVLGKMLETKYSRLPVYDRSLKKIVGVVNLRGILKHIKTKNFEVLVGDVLEPVITVKEDDKLDDAFDRLKEHSSHMAMVVDKKKQLKGLVTMEDLLEEIVGEIYDESDRKRVNIHHIDRKTAIVNGDIMVSELEKIGIELKTKFATMSDLLSARFSGSPKKGDSLKLKNFTLTVMSVDKADPSRIKRIKIFKRRGKIKRK